MSSTVTGQPIQMQNGRLSVPDRPIIPFIEGDGTGPISGGRASACSTRPSRRPTAASGRSPGRKCSPAQKSFDKTGNWLPDETLDAFREFRVGIKGPLTTPVGGGIRSLNVALRQLLDLFVCLRPVRYFQGVPTPGEAAGAGRHGDLPREHRRHLRRHRVRRRHAESRRRCSTSWPASFPKRPARSASARRRKSTTGRSSSKRSARRSATCRSKSASASSRSATSAPSGSCTARSATRSRTSARASRWCTRATS